MKPQLAAGALVWRQTPAGPAVLLVERTKHRDFSLPKGKLDRGETLPACAAREIEEETGITVTLGAPLGHSEYRLPSGQDKVVYYWLAQAAESEIESSSFEPNEEVLALHWLPVNEAKSACTYEHDLVLINEFVKRFEANTTESIAIIALRHARAKDADNSTLDTNRKLSSKGRKQAAGIASGIAAFGVKRIVTSASRRCMETVAPIAAHTGLTPRTSDAITQDEYSHHAGAVAKAVGKALRKSKTTVFCSHLPVIPAIVSTVVAATGADETNLTHRASMLHTADFSVLHVDVKSGTLVGVETHGAPA